MPAPTVRPATSADLPGIARALTASFLDDPVISWVFGGREAHRARYLPAFYRHEGARHLRHQQVLTTDDHAGAALWDPPRRWKTRPRDYLGMALPMLLGVGPRIPRALRGFTRIEALHDAQDPEHHYLSILGTRPDRQGEGVGSALMAPVLEVCDRDGVGAYLESSKERNVPFYRRHGFEVVDEVAFPGGGPTLWAMWRDPRPRETGAG